MGGLELAAQGQREGILKSGRSTRAMKGRIFQRYQMLLRVEAGQEGHVGWQLEVGGRGSMCLENLRNKNVMIICSHIPRRMTGVSTARAEKDCVEVIR